MHSKQIHDSWLATDAMGISKGCEQAFLQSIHEPVSSFRKESRTCKNNERWEIHWNNQKVLTKTLKSKLFRFGIQRIIRLWFF